MSGERIPPNPFARTKPTGELAARMKRIQERLTGGGFPAYTPEFVLADVTLDPAYPRLYSSFSGDISGRYVEALALLPPEDRPSLDNLVDDLLRYQRPDGRFGDPSLSFTAADVGEPHMALLWGNGRLLAGLVTYFQVTGRTEVLDAARRLGDFLLRVRQHCAQPEVAARVEGLGAHGLICFTQLIEGLVLLGQAAGEDRYLEAAREIAPLLPPPGVQHTHGYLSTLRGILLLHEATGDPVLLRDAQAQYDALVRSPDYVVFGGVLEFFGAETLGLSPADLEKLHALDNKPPQDEGCSEADFVRLSLQLWRATGRAEYLERAERCLLNHFYCNQFHSGDFGHRVLFSRGFRPSDSPGKAWWCCNMHGLRTFPDAAEAIVTRSGEAVRLNLFLDCEHTDGAFDFVLDASETGDGVTLRVLRDTDGSVPLEIRHPSWATGMHLRLNGEVLSGEARDGYHVLRRAWRAGDELEIGFRYRERLQLRSGKQIDLADLGEEPVEGALFVGPWLLGVHECDEPAFFERPWTWGGPNENVLRLPASLREARFPACAADLSQPNVACRLEYTHGGWPGRASVTLRPIGYQTCCPHQQVLSVWMTFLTASGERNEFEF